jgi:hypothetical protein
MWPISIGITDEMRTDSATVRSGKFVGQPRKCPPKAYNGNAITPSDCTWTPS